MPYVLSGGPRDGESTTRLPDDYRSIESSKPGFVGTHPTIRVQAVWVNREITKARFRRNNVIYEAEKGQHLRQIAVIDKYGFEKRSVESTRATVLSITPTLVELDGRGGWHSTQHVLDLELLEWVDRP